MRFKAVLIGAEGLDRPMQIFGGSQADCEKWAKGILAGLTPEQQRIAVIRIVEIKDVWVADIYPEKV